MNCDPELALKYAKEKDPGNPFVLSCEQQYINKGSLSAKQIEALYRVSATVKKLGNKIQTIELDKLIDGE